MRARHRRVTEGLGVRHMRLVIGNSRGGMRAYLRGVVSRAPFAADAGDHLYQSESSAGYDPSALLHRIEAPLLAINAADDKRNPPELGIMERELAKVRGARRLLLPASEDTRGHGTTSPATFWNEPSAEWFAKVPRRGP